MAVPDEGRNRLKSFRSLMTVISWGMLTARVGPKWCADQFSKAWLERVWRPC